MILCNVCGKHNATVYFKGMVNDQAVKLHLCEACARKNGMVFPFGKSALSLGDVLSQMASAARVTGQMPGRMCRQCGLTYEEFSESSQFGCSQCYAAFAPVIEPLLKRIHGSSQHVGRPYRRTVRAESSIQELNRLKLELRESIAGEEFEKAARLRDQIRHLEHRMTQSP